MKKYIIIGSYGWHGTVVEERIISRLGYEETIEDLYNGEINFPVQILELDMATRIFTDVTKQVILEIKAKMTVNGEDIPEWAEVWTPYRIKGI